MEEGLFEDEKECCVAFLDNVEPRGRASSRVIEFHDCPTCKKGFAVTFVPVVGLGDDDKQWSVADATPREPA